MLESAIALEQFEHEPRKGRSSSGCGACGTGGSSTANARCGNGLEKIYPTTAVRFGYMRYIGEFSHVPDLKFTCGCKVVIQTQRGIEIGAQVSLSCSGCDKAITREQIKEWISHCGADTYMFNTGRILREATAADLAEFARIQESCREKRDFAQGVADEHKLPLKVVECECPFGGERIIFYFTAGERVDFRGMVKDLAKEYRTRIEMRQVGARDEARLLADFETCGRELCCKTFLKTLKPISMRMAKVQKATLDPSQVSGRCGRLKCCLRYEHVAYEELDKAIPRIGVRIRTNHGEGVVVNRQIITQLVKIRMDNDTLVTVVAEDITAVGVEAPSKEEAQREPVTRERQPVKRKRTPRTGQSKQTSRPPRTRPSPERKERHPTEERGVGPGATQPSAKGEGPQKRRRRRRRRRRPKGGGESGGSGQTPPPRTD